MFYVENNNNIVIADDNKERLETTLKFLPQYKGLEIKESDVSIVQYNDKWYFVNDEAYIAKKQEQEKQRKRQEILDKLDKLDLKSIRAIRANDEEYIAQYEAQAQELRKQLQEV